MAPRRRIFVSFLFAGKRGHIKLQGLHLGREQEPEPNSQVQNQSKQ
jgi:hypothetical protein